LVVNVNPTTPDGTVITNAATALSGVADPNTANNTGTTTTTAANTADLSITKADNPDPVTAGSNLTYTISVTNAGPNDAENVTVTDLVPANTTFVSFTASAGFTNTTPAVGGTGAVTSTGGTVAAGGNAVFTLVVNVNPSAPNGGTIANN